MKRKECKNCGIVNDHTTGIVIEKFFELHNFSGIKSMGVTFSVRCSYCGRRWVYRKKIKKN